MKKIKQSCVVKGVSGREKSSLGGSGSGSGLNDEKVSAVQSLGKEHSREKEQ